MTTQAILLLGCVALLATLWLFTLGALLGRDSDRRDTVARYRAMLNYVATGRAGHAAAMFAHAVLHGHHEQLRRHFPDFGAFLAHELERQDDDI